MTNLTGADVQVRRSHGEDATDIAAVFDAAVSTGWSYLGELAQKSMFSAEHWDRLVAEHGPPDALLLADDPSDGVVGFTAVHVQEGELYLLFVHPDHAGRGLGRRLLEAAHDLMRAAGRGSSFLFTEERNARARQVYEAAGYRPDGAVRRSEFEGQTLRELRLVKDLHA